MASLAVWSLVFYIVTIIIDKVLHNIADKIGEKVMKKVKNVEDYTAAIGNLGFLLSYNSDVEDFRDQIKELRNIKDGVQGLIDASESNREVVLPNVRRWLASVNKIIEESVKFFHEYQENKWGFNGYLPDVKLLCERSKTAKDKTKDVDELKQERFRFDRVFTSTKDADFFESRKSIFKEVMGALKDDRVNMIAIYGMAGVGKTTFAKEVVRLAKADNLFDAVAMVEVSQTPNLKKIQREIEKTVDLKFEKRDKSGRAVQSSTMKKKRILVILDNIWERIELEAIGISSGLKRKGCKVVLISRSQDVCNQMDPDKNFSIEVITDEEGWNLFRKMAGDSVDSPDLRDLAIEVAEECAGLPISIVTVARALKKKGLSVWRDACSQLRKSIPSKKVFSTLELSYNHLESEEAKSFFLLCCLFPENYRIPIRDLLRYGMGLGLFQGVDTLDEARERVHKLANDLKSSCLLLVSDCEKYVKMHDVVRDIAISIASKDKHAFLVRAGPGWKKWPKTDTSRQYNAISLMHSDIHELPDELSCPKLQILLLNHSLQFFERFISEMDNLKVLDMSHRHFWSLPQSLWGLQNLRTLCLDGCRLKYISGIGELRSLEFLSFIGSDIMELPTEIRKLKHLRLLDLTRCEELTIIPAGVIGSLIQLEELYILHSFDSWEIEREGAKRSNASLAELEPLSCLVNLEIEISGVDLLPEDLHFENLSRFKLSVGTKFEKRDQYSYSKILKLELNKSAALRDGVKGLLKKVEHLHLKKMRGLRCVVYDLDGQGFQNLRCLNVDQCRELEYIFNASEWDSPVAFPILEDLYLSQLANLTEIFHGQLSSGFLRNLRVVEVWNCRRLKNLFSHSIAKDLSNLIKITVAMCENMEKIVGDERAAAAAMDNIVFPHLRFLELRDLPNLRNFCSKVNGLPINAVSVSHAREPLFDKKVAFTNLEVLRIINIESLRDIFHSQLPDDSFSQLRFLEVAKCHELSRVGPSKLLLRLEKLETLIVENCNSMEKIFGLEGLVGEGHAALSLYQLEKLELRYLPLLSNFCLGTHIKLPSWITLTLEACPRMRNGDLNTQ